MDFRRTWLSGFGWPPALLSLALLSLVVLGWPVLAAAQPDHTTATAAESAPSTGQQAPEPPPRPDFLAGPARRAVQGLVVQDYQGRMKPLDTLARQMVTKITKRYHFEGWQPVDLYLSWLARPDYWFEYPLLAIRNPGLKQMLGVSPATTHVSCASLLDDQGQYRLRAAVEEALRTPDRDRSKLQRRLLSFDERFNLLYMNFQGRTLRLYPVPGDPGRKWLGPQAVQDQLSDPEQQQQYRHAIQALLGGLRGGDPQRVLAGAAATDALQHQYNREVIPGAAALQSELLLNKVDPFLKVTIPYLLAAVILLAAYVLCLARREGAPFSPRHPLYLAGFLVFLGSVLVHLAGFVLRWIAAGRAPLSNGYESLIFIALMVAVAGLIFELQDRRGVAGGLAALLTAVVLGVSLMGTFDPAIGPLVPVLASYWLNIHVTVITASYGFLGLGFLLGAMVLILYCGKGPGRPALRRAVRQLDGLNIQVVRTGLALLSVGTLLGGVWANESWGRYWGWDPKETWSLVTILVYACVLHFRWVPALKGPWPLAAGSFAGIASVVMTYFGVNYFLSGLHSYAQGDAAVVPTWVYVLGLSMLALILVSRWREATRSWEGPGAEVAATAPAPAPPRRS